MDLQMPICGGIEATQQIRALEESKNWRKSFLFVMTGQDSPADRDAAEEAGADEYFVKPVIIKQLDRVITQYFPAFGSV
jgi:CheY-like chemotaxis protein